MTRIICVLRTGGDFVPKHVKRLHAQVIKYVPEDTSFICLTNRAVEVRAYGIEAKALKHNWQGHGRWSKLEMFRFVGPCLYLDLDLTIVGDLSPLLRTAKEYEFVACFGYVQLGFNSSIMAWNGDLSWIYKMFAAQPEKWMAYYAKAGKLVREKRGHDQGFLNDRMHGQAKLWQEILPGMVMWYNKGDWQQEDRTDCRIVYCTGHPRPWEISSHEKAI